MTGIKKVVRSSKGYRSILLSGILPAAIPARMQDQIQRLFGNATGAFVRLMMPDVRGEPHSPSPKARLGPLSFDYPNGTMELEPNMGSLDRSLPESEEVGDTDPIGSMAWRVLQAPAPQIRTRVRMAPWSQARFSTQAIMPSATMPDRQL